ncbi:MAG: GGDEF domain-containing protein [Gammaproteobacteria bacterium]|nr:GGDEF domain-containing protein [Gammaproteobacteria bacterium]
MKNLTSHFVLYLCTILLLVVGATNYWLYQNNTSQLKSAFDSTAHNHLDDITNLSGYYISHYEYELLTKLLNDTTKREDIIHASIKTISGDINIETGQSSVTNVRQYSKIITYNNEHLGTVNLILDDSQLKHDLNQALINNILLTLFTVLIIGTLVIIFFRSRIMQAMKQANTEKEFFSVVMDSTGSMVIVLEENGQIVLANNACQRYFPDNNMPATGRFLWEFFPIYCEGIPLKNLLKDNKKLAPALDIAHLKIHNCISNCEINHEKTIIEWSFNVIHDDSRNRLIATGVDETLQYMECEKLSYLALHDSLTGLPNRSLFIDRLEAALAQYNRNDSAFCVLYLDLDKFKPINDTHGHEAGDFILKSVSEILLINLRAIDTVARLGGDEFGIILTNIKSRDNAAIVAQKCITAISQPFNYLTQQLQLGVSIGIAYYPDHKCDLPQLINHADAAMYKVKQSGRNGYCFFEDSMPDEMPISINKSI